MSKLHDRASRVRRRAPIVSRLRFESLESRELLTGNNPSVLAVFPANLSLNQPLGTNLVATFNIPLNPKTVAASTVSLKDENGVKIPSTVSYSSTTGSVLLTPSVALQPSEKFTATLFGGKGGIVASNGLSLLSSYTWSFTTENFTAPVVPAVAGVKIDRTSGLVTNSVGGQTTFAAILTSAPTGDVTIPLTSSNPAAGTVSVSSLVFTPDDWNVPQAVLVSGTPSTITSNQTYSIVLGVISSNDIAYNGIDPNDVSIVDQAMNSRQVLEDAAFNETNRFGYSSKYAVATPMPMMMADMTASMMAEQNQVLALVPISSMTNKVVQSGDWSNPLTWSNQRVPAAGANVWVMPGRTLTVDGDVAPDIHAIRVSGTLNFSTTTSTSLNVDTIEVDPMGTLQMGTIADPIPSGVTTDVTFTDSGPIDRVWDPYGYSRGLISQGSASIVGAAKTGSVPLALVPQVGATSIDLDVAPTGWEVGDVIDIPGTSGGGDEQFVITGISASGTTINLNAPIALARSASEPGQSIVVANLTRNINFSSQNTTDSTRRGHVMFMHNDDVIAEYAGFNGLGRTNFSIPINNAVVDKNGFLVPGTGTNPKGRYAFHIHMAGTDMPMNPIMVLGDVVNDSASWGFDNHGSNVDFEDDVAYNTAQAGFATESGNEIGTFNNDVAINGQHYGFWLNGPYVAFTNNVATGFNGLYGAGVEVWAYSNAGAGGVPIYFDASLVTPEGGTPPVDPLVPTGRLRIELLPFHLENTEVYNSWGGIEIRAHQGDLGPNYRSTVDGGAIWGVHRGLTFNYSTSITIYDLSIQGDGQWDSSGVYGDLGPTDLTFNNVSDTDWGTGINFPPAASFTVQGGLFNNTVNFRISTFDPGSNSNLKSRGIVISGVTYGTTLSPSLLIPSPNSDPYNVYLDSTPVSGSPLNRFLSDQILLDGLQVYFLDQAADYIVTGTGMALYDGLTNAQLMSRYGIATRGGIMPIGARSDSSIYGGMIF